jgi:hypothetical protein
MLTRFMLTFKQYRKVRAMDPMNKPEWFQIAENDGVKPRKTVKRGVRAFALSLPLLAIGIGVVVAQSSDESPANADSTSVAATASPKVSTPSVAPKVVSAPSKSVQPAIAKPPKAPTDGEDDDHREGGEHEEFGDDD